ncbi:D-aspartate oxidase-like isoform X2 [Ostrea edulis]|uniref:D-aspartate oxidase-like isoform X2 n=1 Tax=Ostrea edulis TaxID=37623 RepID=UPI0024AED946|nr:D-aspartate oxidase-like isoform X2 [Ostrea edulis]
MKNDHQALYFRDQFEGTSGAGVIGLSSAVNVQLLIPGVDITIIADQFATETTSDGAAGHFGILSERTNADTKKLSRWTHDSFEWYHQLYMSEESNSAGVLRLFGYQLWSSKRPAPFHSKFDYTFRELSKKELQRLPGNHTYGWAQDSLMVECRRYLPWLLKKFKDKGGKIVRRRLNNINEIGESYDVIVNCTGLGSRTLFNDKMMVPIRGHTIRAKAPWIKHFYIGGNGDTYIYPGQDNVVLGGTRQRGEECLKKDQKYFDDIIDRCCTLVPSLKHADIEKLWVGLRPWRSTVRLEMEVISINDRRLPVVHNYGHGSDGVCLSWGCGVDAAHLVKEQLGQTGAQQTLSKL